jgi:hypothetical protein
MSKIITNTELEQFKKDGAVLIKGKFDNVWIKKLKEGIKKAKNNPSPRFVNHTKDKKLPGTYMKNLKILFLIHQHLKLQQNF